MRNADLSLSKLFFYAVKRRDSFPILLVIRVGKGYEVVACVMFSFFFDGKGGRWESVQYLVCGKTSIRCLGFRPVHSFALISSSDRFQAIIVIGWTHLYIVAAGSLFIVPSSGSCDLG